MAIPSNLPALDPADVWGGQMNDAIRSLHLGPGTHASIPAANAVPEGSLYSCTDHSVIHRTNGSAWSDYAAIGGSGGTSRVLVSDDFNRADSTSSLGGTWVAVVGAWGISSNKAYTTTASGSSVAAIEAGQADMSVKARLTSVGNDDGLAARVSDANNFYACDFLSGSAVRLLRKSGGSFTTLGQTGSLPPGTSLSSVDVELRCVGDVISIFINGMEVVSAVDTSPLSGTKAGLWQGTAKAGPRWDNFSATAPSSAAATYTYPPGSADKPQSPANAKTDEFDGSSSVVWSDTPTAPNAYNVNSTREGHAYVKASGSGATFVGKYQAIPAAFPFTVTAKNAGHTARANYHKGGGLLLLPASPTSASGAIYIGVGYNNSPSIPTIGRAYYTNMGTTYQNQAGPFTFHAAAGPHYVKATFTSATSMSWWWSLDGFAWIPGETGYTTPFSVANIGWAVTEENALGGVEAFFDFFRVS